MKKLVVTIATCLLSVQAFGQGTIYFNNLVTGATPPINAPVFGFDGITGLGAYGGNAQLYLVTGAASYVPLLPATTFRTTPAAAQGYVMPVSSVTVPNIPAGQQATVVMRAWIGPTYENSGAKAQSNPITITLGGDIPGQPPAVPANLLGLQGFSIPPEPSTLTLVLLGAAALLCRRQKITSISRGKT